MHDLNIVKLEVTSLGVGSQDKSEPPDDLRDEEFDLLEKNKKSFQLLLTSCEIPNKFTFSGL